MIATCDVRPPAVVTHVAVPGTPFEAISSRDGCWIFVSLMHEPRMPSPGPAAIALLRREGGSATIAAVIPLDQSPRGMVLTHDGSLLVIAADSAIVFVDVARAEAGDARPVVGEIRGGGAPYRILPNVTRDDHWLFVSDERMQSITVVDLAAARRNHFAESSIVGRIPLAIAPIAVELSPDERYLYATSERGLPAYGWPIECRAEGTNPATRAPPSPVGAVFAIDVGRAARDPAHSVMSTVRAGCSPVRLVLSPQGDIAFVTARNSNAVLAFDTAKLLGDTAHALIDSIPVGSAPVGIALVDGGRHLVVANSDRFSGDTSRAGQLAVIDASDLRRGARVVGRIAAGVFPRELHVTGDGGTLLVTNFTSRTIELIPLPLDSSAVMNR